MDRRQRLRQAGALCIHTITNVACYRAGFQNGKLVSDTHFWMMVSTNFSIAAVLNWCKLFADKKGKHYAWKVVSDPNKFKLELLAHLKISQHEFDDFVQAYKKIRDKYIAHLDDEVSFSSLPKFDIGLSSASFLLQYLSAHENADDALKDIPRRPGPIYQLSYSAARTEYGITDVRVSGSHRHTQD